jgi:flagellar M-ring protein FliF
MPVRQLASNLTARGWLIAGASAIGAILFVYLFVHMVSQPGYATLATGLEPAQTGKMTSTLDQHGISYQLQNNGTALAVQSNETAQARVALSGAGLLGDTQPGFQQLYEKSSLSESTFQQQVTYQRALQGQLEQTISTVQGVSGTQVELVLPNPQSQLFGESQAPSSAAVLLTGSSALEPSAVRGIAQLVSSSVPGLALDKVTITSGSGQLLWPTQGSEGAGATARQAAQERYDQAQEANLNSMLAQTLGPGKAQVQVSAELNTNQTTQEALTYGKTGVPLQQSKDLETLAGNGGGTGGAAGTANIPAYAQTGTSGKSNYKHETTTSTLGVDKTVTHSTIPPGEVTSQHVSVLLDSSVPAAAVPAIKEAVTNAAGIKTSRGDTLSIGQLAFAKQTAPAAAGATSGILGDAKYALIGLASLVFLFFTTRVLRRREQEGIDHEPAWLRELELPVRLSELERETPARPTESMASVPAPGTGNPARRQAEQLAESSPERVAQQLRSWMQED